MSHGARQSKGKTWQVEFSPEHNGNTVKQPTTSVLQSTTCKNESSNKINSQPFPKEGNGGSFQTMGSHTRVEEDVHSNIRVYVANIDQINSRYRARERTKFKVISAITGFLSKDSDLTSQERSQSLKLYLAEINLIETNLLLSSEFGQRCRVRSRARRWLQLVGCAALLLDASNFGGPDGVGESGIEPRRSLRKTRAS